MGQEIILFFREVFFDLISFGIHYYIIGCLPLVVAIFWRHERIWEFTKPFVGYFERISESKTKSIVFVALLAFASYGLFALCFRFPHPIDTDEFSYLLTADTFLNQRLTNPTHPFWKHFEYFGIFQHPTYNSKYPVGQAVALAVGKLLTGYPIIGVWMSGAAACVAVWWMLRGWFSPRWALFGAVITIYNPIIFLWSQNYWGGYIAMIGGSLSLGAVLRITARPKVIDAIIFAVGLSILSNSRPYEGFLFALPLSIFLFFSFLSNRDSQNNILSFLRKTLLPISLVLILNSSWLAYNNYRVTGNYLKLPYMEYTEQYDYIPLFLFQKMDKPKVYDNIAFETSYSGTANWEGQKTKSLYSIIRTIFARIIIFYVSFMLSPVLLFLFLRSLISKNNDKRWLYLKTFLLLFTIGIALPTYFLPHYAAPAYGLFIILLLGNLRDLWHSENKRISGRLVILLIPVCLLTGIILFGALYVTKRNFANENGQQRAAIEAALKNEGGRHLIFVDPYLPGSQILVFGNASVYVYNEADIDNSKIVWAHQLNPIDNARLVDYLGDRKVWLLKLDEDGKPQLLPYH